VFYKAVPAQYVSNPVGLPSSYCVKNIPSLLHSYMNCQSYWNMYHWQSEHECGTRKMVLRHSVRCSQYHDRWIGRGGPTAWPPRSPDLNPLDSYLWGYINTLVYAAPVDNEEALHHRTVDACQTIRNYPATFERIRRSMSRRALNLVEGILSTYYKCTLSATTQ
jgi:hypothetical protein